MEKIYKAEFVNGEWTNIQELPFSSDNYKTAHPALSPDEKTMYFASDMPGSFGNSDLYKVSIDSNGNFCLPENKKEEIEIVEKLLGQKGFLEDIRIFKEFYFDVNEDFKMKVEQRDLYEKYRSLIVAM